MSAAPVFDVSGSSNAHRCYLLRDASNVLSFTERPWGSTIAPTWVPPELVPFEQTAALPDADFCAFYLPGLLVASRSAADAVSFPELERLPVRVGNEERFLLNPQITLTRFREDNAKVVRLPDGPVLFIDSADFYAEDVPSVPRIFWLHDGTFPRFLLCNEPFRVLVRNAGLTGITFKFLGHAHSDG